VYSYTSNVRKEQHANIYEVLFALCLSAARYSVFVDNAYRVHRTQNYTVKAKEQNYWRKHYNFPTFTNGSAVCLCLALRCWFKKETFTVRIIIGKSKTAASEIYATG
jgi:hypothetical protein